MPDLITWVPDLKPIEKVFAVIKVPKGEGAEIIVAPLPKFIGKWFGAIAPSGCPGCFSHAGYRT